MPANSQQNSLRPRLWVVSELFYPEQTSTGYFLTRIAEGLAGDFEVHAVCGRPSYSERGLKVPRHEYYHGIEIHRLAGTAFDKDRLFLRMINFLSFSISLLLFALRRFGRNDRVLVVTNPPLAPAIIAFASWLKGARSTLLVHDVYPDIAAAAGILSRNSLPYRLADRFFSFVLDRYQKIVVLGRDMQEVVGAKLSGRADRVAIIPNWGDTDEIAPIRHDDNPFRTEHGFDGKFVVQFSGNIGRSHDVEMILEAANLLADEERIVFAFIGYGGKTALVSDAAHQNQGNIVFLPRQPREKLAEMLASSDVTIIPFVDGMYGLSVPSRMYNVMASGTPILASADPRSELALTVTEGNAGWVLEQRDGPGLAALLRRISETQDTSRKGHDARRHVENNYTFEKIVERFRAILR